MKKLLSLILALAMVLALVACGNKTTDDSNAAGNGDTTDADPIRIGFFAPVSAASAAADGQSAEQSAKLAVKLINEAGGINGRKVELVNYDDGLDTAEAANILEKLTTVDNVDAIVSGSYSGPTKVAAPICQDAGIVMVSAYAVHPDVVNAGDFIFSQSFPGAVQATAAAQFAVGELKANRIAIVAVDLDFGKEQAAYFKAQAAKLGAEIVSEDYIAISDNDMTEAMIREFIHMVNGGAMMKPRIVLCVPSSVTDVERRAVVEAAMSAGARKVFLIEEPIAALIGAGVDISKPNGTMVVDIGGGTADVAIVSFNGIVQSRSIKMAGNKFDQAIIRHITQKYKILIGEKTAEKAKMEIANVFDPTGEKKMTIRGRNLLKGLPESIEISDQDIYDAIHENAMEIVEQVKLVLESTPPELVGDILSNGILLTGGGAMLGGLPELISDNVGAPCFVAENPIECVARGVDAAFKMSGELLDGFEQIQLYNFK